MKTNINSNENEKKQNKNHQNNQREKNLNWTKDNLILYFFGEILSSSLLENVSTLNIIIINIRNSIGDNQFFLFFCNFFFLLHLLAIAVAIAATTEFDVIHGWMKFDSIHTQRDIDTMITIENWFQQFWTGWKNEEEGKSWMMIMLTIQK